MAIKKKWLRHILHRDHLIVVVLALVLTFFVGALFDLLGTNNPYLKSVSSSSLTGSHNLYNEDREGVSVNNDIVVIDLGYRANKNHVADILQQLDSLRPIAVGLDAIFPASSDAETEEKLKGVLQEMQTPVVLAQMMDDEGQVVKSFFADSLGLTSGDIMFDLEGGTVHTFRAIQENGDSTMAALLNDRWNKHYGIKQRLKLTKEPLTIDYNYDVQVVPSDKIEDYADDIEGRIVLIGVASTGGDTFRVPIERAYMSGVEVHAVCLATLHDTKSYPWHVPFILNMLIAFVVCYVFEVLLSLVLSWLPQNNRPWVIFLREWIKSSYLTNIVLLPLLMLLTILMLNATMHGRYYMLTFIFTAVVLVMESRYIYKAAVTALSTKYSWPWLKNSIFAN